MEHVIVTSPTSKAMVIEKDARLGKLAELEDQDIIPTSEPAWPATKSSKEVATGDPLETVLESGVTIYGDEETLKKLTEVIEPFPNLWKQGGVLDLPKELHVKVPLKTNWKSLDSKLNHRIYNLGLRHRNVVDRTLDGMHNEGRISITQTNKIFIKLCIRFCK